MKNLKILIFSIMISMIPMESKAGLMEGAFEAVKSALSDFGGGLSDYNVTPLTSIYDTTQWGLFFSEFEIGLDIGWCSYGYFDLPGFKATSVEPVAYFESSKSRWNFLFADIDLSSAVDLLQTGESRNTHGQDENNGGRDDIVWTHYIKFPIFGILFGSNVEFVCFTAGGADLFLFSEYLPGYLEDVLYVNIIPDNIIIYTPASLVTAIVDCVSATTVNLLHGFLPSGMTKYTGGMGPISDTDGTGTSSSAEYVLNSIRNGFYWNVGCDSFSPVGGYIEAEDPGTDNETIAHGMMNLIHGASAILPISFLKKQTEFVGMALPTMCYPLPYPKMIDSQYLLQRAGIPSIGSAHAFGSTPATTTTLVNLPGSKDGWVNLIWEYRDYYAFAYHCPQI